MKRVNRIHNRSREGDHTPYTLSDKADMESSFQPKESRNVPIVLDWLSYTYEKSRRDPRGDHR